MALPKSIGSIKANGSKEDKTAVAGGIAISVVVVLLVGWAFFFLRDLSQNPQNLRLGGGVSNQIDWQSVTQAQQQLQQTLGNTATSDLIQLRQDINAQGSGAQQQAQQTQGQAGAGQFGTPNASE